MEQIEQMVDIIAVLSEMGADSNVPKNVRMRVQDTLIVLQSANDHSMKVHESMNILDTLSSDINLDSYTRTQLFSIISMLEKMN